MKNFLVNNKGDLLGLFLFKESLSLTKHFQLDYNEQSKNNIFHKGVLPLRSHLRNPKYLILLIQA